MPWVTTCLPACCLLACHSAVMPLAHALCILCGDCESQKTTSIYLFTLSSGPVDEGMCSRWWQFGEIISAMALSVPLLCSGEMLLNTEHRGHPGGTVKCEHWLLSNSAHLLWISLQIGWYLCVDWDLILGCSSGWEGLKCRFASIGFSLQLEMENLMFLGSIHLGCRQTFPGAEHKWHWNHVWHHLCCDSLVHFIVRELVC